MSPATQHSFHLGDIGHLNLRVSNYWRILKRGSLRQRPVEAMRSWIFLPDVKCGVDRDGAAGPGRIMRLRSTPCFPRMTFGSHNRLFGEFAQLRIRSSLGQTVSTALHHNMDLNLNTRVLPLLRCSHNYHGRPSANPLEFRA